MFWHPGANIKFYEGGIYDTKKDLWLRCLLQTETASSVLVAAHNKEEARRIAKEVLDNMPKEELISRFLAAVDFEPNFQITYIDKVDELNEEEN